MSSKLTPLLHVLAVVLVAIVWPARLGFAAGPELHGNAEELTALLAGLPKPTAIAGHATKEFQADRAVVLLLVVTEDDSLNDALNQNLRLRRELLQALTKRGIGKERINSSKFSSIPERGKISGKIRQYHVENQVRIAIESEEEFLAVAEQVDRESKLQYQRMDMEDSQKATRELAVLGQALDQVLVKKKTLEEKLGITLVPKQVTQPLGAEPRIGFQGGSPPANRSLSTPLPSREDLGSAIWSLEQRSDAGWGFGQVQYSANVVVLFEAAPAGR